MEGMQEASLAEEMRHVTRKGKTGSLHRCWHASHNAAVGSRGSTTISKSLRTAIPKELLGSVRRELRALVRKFQANRANTPRTYSPQQPHHVTDAATLGP
uniref:Uncharacterized protein n=1 Tax=Coccidioides posadasii RMSCC 3488 TaxID=454284 RepID=A0A0J6FPZ8_COCPO|nr:hypothetical protein CPAG_08747 [Coccidioides posadasii RMSCC 3488]